MSSNFLYIFIDESGNFDFSTTGTHYFVLTAVTTLKPFANRNSLREYRYEQLQQGFDQELFHATEDAQVVRDKVYDLIENNFTDITVDSIVAEKCKAHPSLYTVTKVDNKRQMKQEILPDEFYRLNCQTLLRYITNRYQRKQLGGIVIVLASIFTNQRSKIILKTLKSYLKQFCSVPFQIYFHQSQSDINSQIADYCGWAVYVQYERGESRPLTKISDKLKSKFEIFQRGTTKWY
jgi:hypothetical protein